MTDIDKLARELAENINVVTTGTIEFKNGVPTGVIVKRGAVIALIKTALAAYANDYCDSLLFVLADIRQKTGVGDKPMLGELADAIVANKLAYGDECAKQMRDEAICAYNTNWNCEPIEINNAIRALPLPSEKVKP